MAPISRGAVVNLPLFSNSDRENDPMKNGKKRVFMSVYEELLQKLAPYGQEHLLSFWEELSDEERDSLRQQIDVIDFDLLKDLFVHRSDPSAAAELAYRAEEPSTAYKLSDLRDYDCSKNSPYPQSDAMKLDETTNSITPLKAVSVGEKYLREGKIAVVVVAGGQGTRLGYPYAKGLFRIGPHSHATLFQIHVERILAMQRKYGVRLPFCIQTSPVTHQEIIDFFKENNNFGLHPDDVLVFCQDTMPSVDFDSGKVLLADKAKIARNPNGHGGMLEAINSPQPDSSLSIAREKGVLAELKSRGIEELFYFQIDNPLVDICNPEFIGYHVLNKSDYTLQAIRKNDPKDRVGNIVMIDGRLYIIEYSDLPDEVGARRKSDGTLEIWAGSIAVHMMNVEFLQKNASYSSSLPFHFAKKKVKHVVFDKEAKGENGEPLYGTVIDPDSPNATKYEKFIFDLLPLADNPIVVEIDKETGFAPLKNRSGEKNDTPETVQKHLTGLSSRWLSHLGIKVPDEKSIEISPLFANSCTELADRLKKLEMFPADGIIKESAYWSEDSVK
ncbi:MAG: UTP--glucose-1-phosphate uridylyltransferase [Thermoguttaceae bacterium]|nr:UTP--glucose-1-phosphate uridylyltransferase [Thermoguttaceae bacterium]